MADRAWFFAFQGQQHGPYPEPQFRQFIADGHRHRGDAGLDRGHGELAKGRGYSRPFVRRRRPCRPCRDPAAAAVSGSGHGGRAFDRFGSLGFRLAQPDRVARACCSSSRRPGSIVMYCKWIVSCVHVPGRPQPEIHGPARDADVVFRGSDLHHRRGSRRCTPRQRRLGHRSAGSLLAAHQMVRRQHQFERTTARLAVLGLILGHIWAGICWPSFPSITIIGWAWVYTAQIRWMCRHVEGTRREVVFNATGLEFLWRSVVTFIACAFIIPIPWVMSWFIGWQVSQVELVERSADAQRLNAFTCAGAASLPAPPTPPACRPA